MNDELKPCPFCGDDRILVYEEGDYGYSDVVKCQKCGIQFILPGETKQNTINAWNTRFESDELPEWVKEAIDNEILGHIAARTKYNGIRAVIHDSKIKALEWVLSLRKSEDNECEI